ncbi:hypothetical protein [Microbacterium amylolyticum]|uniref:ATP-binding protein n=1 Tax=Microbacterium amylolyticum TaxID=936337 RepID=A0ABS4ZKT5_9MICO|nr:hypothetical protein [Microbacterium amylolyticum]MBP2437905.1 hypothetical protein [Microbacterium amylolyticum]
MIKQQVEFRDGTETRKARQARLAERKSAKKAAKPAATGVPRLQVGAFPLSKMPRTGWKTKNSMRSVTRVDPIPHRASTRVLATAYPFLTESGKILRGAYVGENMLSRSPFCFDPWDAYSDGIIKSHSAAIIGVKGTGKSMLGKSLSSRLARLGRCIAVPHDPNGEWVRVAEYVGGKSIRVGLGIGTRINLLDAGVRDDSVSRQAWREYVLQERRATVKAVVRQLRQGAAVNEFEHTAIDEVVDSLMGQDIVTVVDVFHALRKLESNDELVRRAAHALAHTMRRLVAGDLAGMFDGPSTVDFDPTSPMMVVDTSGLKSAAADMQALARLATTRWVRNATTGANRRPRVIVHEEAAIALMNDVYGGAGLMSRVADEKVARHDGTSNWYLLHRIADLDALGDEGSATRTQAIGLLADCETRVSYQQHPGEVARSARTLGWNQTMSNLVPSLKKGEGLWQMGQSRIALVRNKLTPREIAVFSTDGAGGAR